MVMLVNESMDFNAIQRLDELGGSKLVIQMIDLFCDNADDKIKMVLQAWEQRDLRTIERSAHSLVSSSGNLGAIHMQELSIQIEQLAANGDMNSFPSLLIELQSAFEQAQFYLAETKKGYEE